MTARRDLENAGSLMEDLYREVILEHYRSPRNKGELEAPTCAADGANPLCGDEIHLDVQLDGDNIEALRFSGQGCSISQASASMMTEQVNGLDRAGAQAAIDAFQQLMLTGEAGEYDLGDSEMLAGVAKFPARVKCASLAWKTLEQALKPRPAADPATTDERTNHDG
ncbi:MAG: SUF system NifU family Fe-S cluster assembly protein [Chloroflexi bacterium]|nr:SUF system NifU family Fe-S cluster assembly protein [Chloroflexota bacterium]MDA1145118.1 SUF system NifU family Fe-S cluster assembly protein [Chloroflexota bacterium]